MQVIEPTLREMKDKMRESRDLEELSSTHLQYTTSLLHQCLLTENVFPSRTNLIQLSTIRNTITDILTISSTFVQNYLSYSNESLSAPAPVPRHRRTSSADSHPPAAPSEALSQADFTAHVKHVDDRFLRAIPFIRSGIKASFNAADFPSLGILAAQLEAGVR
jgi:Gamma tubulin complex component C-terminal